MYTQPAARARPEVHGHRGCRGLLPENTLPAFQHALALGVDALELDVVVSQDHEVVVSHEPWLSARLGRGPQGEIIDPAHERNYNLYQLPYANIRQCAVGEWAHPDFPAQQPVPSHRPLLREVLVQAEAASRQAVRYSVEIKSSPEGDDLFHPAPSVFVGLVLAELRVAGVLARTTLLSFDPRVLQAARQAQPDLALCLLLEDYLPPVSELFAELGFEPATLGPDFRLLSAPLVQAIRAAYPALRLVPWTVNEPADLRLVWGWGVDGITTDYPDRLLALLNQV
ncbi:MAG TPA: glycerophosphodiester phosphodiesterase family protein [Hymenobacter sp.]|uniref:glycerophosphodiester phosphodiesterase family protein n=1 Tax=Hymenobacter sp. TaxID=1898978 RepID=UPI002D805179|nr:glycerophosphodiester phosphodiesterase family protein [Hymenobacter sp.]HET9503399.1 glycerophosphodiester phosphodiesterase family protein [Hymenobacter sp.]